VEREQRSTNSPSLLNEEPIRTGMRVLFWQLLLCLSVALLGSLAFRSGRFDGFPYSWF
jgi:hypothetical protein